MKIAVASDDRVHIANHFGRTLGFLVYDVEDSQVQAKHYTNNDFTHHAHGHHHDHQQGHHHSHQGILKALEGCEVVISRGMGRRLLNDFGAVGKKVFITWSERADEAVNLYLKGELQHDPDKSCQH